MASTEFGTGKSILVLAIVVGCFAILWPKIFYPMMQAAFSITAPKQETDEAFCQVKFERDKKDSFFFANLCDNSVTHTHDDIHSTLCNLKQIHDKAFHDVIKYCNSEITTFCDGEFIESENTEEVSQEKQDNARRLLNECLRKYSEKIYDTQYLKRLLKRINSNRYTPSGERPPHLHPGEVHPRLKEKGAGTRHAQRMREGRPFPHPSARHPPKPQPKSGGAMSIIMPIYTIGIVVFFVYTVLKLVFKNKTSDDKTPKVKDFHMDPEYHKYVLQDEYAEATKTIIKEDVIKKKPETIEEIPPEKEDYEIYQLRKRLQEMEATMERIVSHMGAVSECIASNITTTVQTIDANKSTDSVSNVSTIKEIETTEKQAGHEAPKTLPINVLKEQEVKTCSEELSPNVDSYEIVGSSFPTTPIEEIGSFDSGENSLSEKELTFSEAKQTSQDVESTNNDKNLSSHQELRETISFDRESSVTSEASSFELLCHSRDTRSTSPAISEGKENEFDNVDNKTDSVGSIENINYDHFSSEDLSSDQQECFENINVPNVRNQLEDK